MFKVGHTLGDYYFRLDTPKERTIMNIEEVKKLRADEASAQEGGEV